MVVEALGSRAWGQDTTEDQLSAAGRPHEASVSSVHNHEAEEWPPFELDPAAHRHPGDC